MKEYKVKFLNDAEFDRLPFQKVRESLGCANPSTKTAYIRKNKIKPIESFVTAHEIDELVNKYSEHEDSDGIRYKKGSAIAQMIAPLAVGLLTGGTGFALAPWFGSTATGALGGALTGAGIAKHRDQSPLMGALGGGLGGAGGASFGAGWASPGTTATTAAGGVEHAVKPTLWQRMAGGANALMGAGPVGNVGGAATTGGPTGNLMWGTQGQIGQGGATPVTGMAGKIGGAQMQPWGTSGPSGFVSPSAGGTGGGGLMGGKGFNLPRTLTGAGISGIGQLTKPDIQFPDLMGAGGVQGFQKLLQTGPSGIDVSDSLRTQLEDEVSGKYDQLRQQVKDRFKQLRPGADFESDSDYQKAISDLDVDEQDELTNAVSNYQENQYQTQLQGMQYLSQMDIYQLMGETGLDVANAQDFQNWLQQIGGGVFQSGLGMM